MQDIYEKTVLVALLKNALSNFDIYQTSYKGGQSIQYELQPCMEQAKQDCQAALALLEARCQAEVYASSHGDAVRSLLSLTGDGRQIVSYTQQFMVKIRTMSPVAPETLKRLIQNKYEVLQCTEENCTAIVTQPALQDF